MATKTLPGMMPMIINLKPRLGGKNNSGVGVDSNGNEYVVKKGKAVGIAEFVGAAVCDALSVRCTRPHVVQLPSITGYEYCYGSAIEKALHTFNRYDLNIWSQVLPQTSNTTVFSTVLAIDLCIGNDDRHEDNWLVADKNVAAGIHEYEVIAMDFSNSWPVCHPPHEPRSHSSINTWSVTKDWSKMGIDFDQMSYRKACSQLGNLDAPWLRNILTPLISIWLSPAELLMYSKWWSAQWNKQVLDVIYCLESDGDWT